MADNPVCPEVGIRPDEYCTVVKQNSTFSYPKIECPHCGQDRDPRPSCVCVYPAKGTLIFRSPSFSDYSEDQTFFMLWQSLSRFFIYRNYPVESVAIRNIREDETDHHLLIDLLIFPDGKDSFNRTGMGIIISRFSNQTYKPDEVFGPYVFLAAQYKPFEGIMK